MMLFAEYRRQAQAQFHVLTEQVKAQQDQIDAIAAGIGPVPNNIGLPQVAGAGVPADGPYRSLIDRCRNAWSDFREFSRSVAHGAVVHALAQLRSHYPLVDLQRIATGYAGGTNAASEETGQGRRTIWQWAGQCPVV